ncbi:MAG: 23S rRNA (pseudouridine(1915)-N(3))-methyltransferase RlmH [Candidatus Poseidoniaceae archaeon]
MGRINIHLHGKLKDKAIASIAEMYQQRLLSAGVKTHVHTDSLDAYLAKLKGKKGRLILLDERGDSFESIQFAAKINEWKIGGEDVHFAIGPAEGWAGKEPTLKRISLSSFTFTHEMATIILFEQLYRAHEILKGTSYHKD